MPRDRTEEGEERRAAGVLAERARALAVPPAPPLAEGERLDVVAFEAGPERYAVTLGAVLRVERVGAVARVPGAAADVVGVMSVDGRPCPLVDAPALLGGGAAAAPRRWAIVLGRRAPELALAADVIDVLRIARAELHEAAPPLLGTTGAARVVLDGAALLGDAPPGPGGDGP
ncbi:MULTISPECIES: chemotaxis protein CheW [unclassified Anaeromyxobacter]|uniref:chemotaxis protein CheW n=1 Tax=unclassified Anaeromyxobacter TaxID=2620896 RepID=UPI001F563CD2|nr:MULTISPECIES: chemotaxis protein CheW [unclassified Anaeromyxobacter]